MVPSPIDKWLLLSRGKSSNVSKGKDNSCIIILIEKKEPTEEDIMNQWKFIRMNTTKEQFEELKTTSDPFRRSWEELAMGQFCQ